MSLIKSVVVKIDGHFSASRFSFHLSCSSRFRNIFSLTPYISNYSLRYSPRFISPKTAIVYHSFAIEKAAFLSSVWELVNTAFLLGNIVFDDLEQFAAICEWVIETKISIKRFIVFLSPPIDTHTI